MSHRLRSIGKTEVKMVIRFLAAFLFVFLLSSFTAERHPAVTQAYIERYQDLAVAEMFRSGIPASVKLAQALHESQSGTSPLAQQANNHFGIKCKSWWTGNTYYHKDDDFNKKGELIESCFRSYSSVVDSYLDHSDFLMYRPRYAPLFEIPRTDYKAWARGLQELGYATDSKYAEKIIRLIETYDLARLDKQDLLEIPKQLSSYQIPEDYQRNDGIETADK